MCCINVPSSALGEHADQRLVLLIDQFEEVFTQLSKDKAAAFIKILDYVANAQNGRVILLFALRSDFIASCVIFPELRSSLTDSSSRSAP